MKINKYQIRFFSVGSESKGGDAILIEVFDENDKPHLAIIDGKSPLARMAVPI